MPEEPPRGRKLDWAPVERPARAPLRGTHVLLRPVSPDDAEALHSAGSDPAIWTYMPDGPYESAADLREMLEWAEASEDPLFFTVAGLPGETPLGIASYLRIEPQHGAIEIGHIWFGSPLQRTTAATEAVYLLARHAFDDLGYRRLEWKCNALNAASRSAAERFGFTFEGVFRNHMVLKGRNRDSAWYSIVDDEWPAIRDGFERWLAPDNFDAGGRQRRSLRDAIEDSRAG
jgi:RimJ/RimL family protein N-acetyltransferase